MTIYAEVLVAQHPGSQWAIFGNDYETLIWYDDTPKPTQAELDAAWPAVQQARADAKEAQEAARQSAINKLAALGLSVDEISAAFGLGDN